MKTTPFRPHRPNHNVMNMNPSLPLAAWRRGLWLLLAAVLSALPGRAQSVPNYMTYQGYLTDQNGTALATNGPQAYSVVFRIWNQPTGGAAPLYGELQTVTVQGGYFSILLGQGTTYVNAGATDPKPPLSAVFTNNNLYVEMTVKGIGSGGADVTILPRLQLVSTPYTFLAANANTLVSPTTGNTLLSSSNGGVVVNGTIIANNFSGNGSGLTSLTGVAQLLGTNIFTGNQTVNGTVAATSFAGDGGSLTNLNVANLIGVARLAGGNAFTGTQTFTNGNLGIGTTTPGLNTVQINTNYESANGYGLVVDDPSDGYGENIQVHRSAGQTGLALVVDDAANGDNGTDLLLLRNNVVASPNTVMVVQAGGFVGIGTSSPKAPLDVENNIPLPTQQGTLAWASYGPPGTVIGYLESQNQVWAINDFGGNDNLFLSVYASGSIQSAGFYAVSDERIKVVKGQSDSATDLQTLLGVKVTDFRYKDWMAHGGAPVKKLIAQQVEKVYPQAVSRSTDVVPDIYQRATVQDGWVRLATDLKVGERVKLICDKDQSVHEVLEVRDGAFRTDLKPATDQVFVYGREVKDFRSVDYDAIAMLNVSATQELAKRLAALEARETHLAELEQKAGRVATLERDLADLKATVAQLAAESRSAKLAAQPLPQPQAPAAPRPTLTTASLDR